MSAVKLKLGSSKLVSRRAWGRIDLMTSTYDCGPGWRNLFEINNYRNLETRVSRRYCEDGVIESLDIITVIFYILARTRLTVVE